MIRHSSWPLWTGSGWLLELAEWDKHDDDDWVEVRRERTRLTSDDCGPVLRVDDALLLALVDGSDEKLLADLWSSLDGRLLLDTELFEEVRLSKALRGCVAKDGPVGGPVPQRDPAPATLLLPILQ